MAAPTSEKTIPPTPKRHPIPIINPATMDSIGPATWSILTVSPKPPTPPSHPPSPPTNDRSPDLEARLLAAPKAPRRMLEARARDAKILHLHTQADSRAEARYRKAADAERRVEEFREEFSRPSGVALARRRGGRGGGGTGLRGAGGTGLRSSRSSPGGEVEVGFGGDRKVGMPAGVADAAELGELDEVAAHRRYQDLLRRAENRGAPQDARLSLPDATPRIHAPNPRRLEFYHHHQLHHNAPRFLPSGVYGYAHVPSPLATPFTTPPPSPKVHNHLHLDSHQYSAPEIQPPDPDAAHFDLSTYLNALALSPPSLPNHQLASHRLAHLSTSRALLLLAHRPREATKVFELSRKVYGLRAVVAATREAECLFLGGEIRHWKLGMEFGRGSGELGYGGGGVNRRWAREAAGGFGALAEACKEVGGGGRRMERVGEGGRRGGIGDAGFGADAGLGGERNGEREVVEQAEVGEVQVDEIGTKVAGRARTASGKRTMSLGEFLAEA